MLTVKGIENAKPRGKNYKLYDEKGLMLIVAPSGGKWFRFKYTRPGGGANWISLGTFPEVTLAEARDARDAARKLLREGKDPSQERKAEKLARAQTAADTFETVAKKYIDKRKYSDPKSVLNRLEKYVFPKIGALPITSIKPRHILAIIDPIDDVGKHDTAHRILQLCGQIFRFGLARELCCADPTVGLGATLTPRDPKNFAAITDRKEVGPLLRMIDGYSGAAVVRLALSLIPLIFIRPGELRKMRWKQIDLEAAELCFVISKRKRGKSPRELIVPLCHQAVEILRLLKGITGASEYVFPSVNKGPGKPISENTLNAALRALGIPKDQMCSHGFRAMARTIMAQDLHIDPEIIELQLGHAVKDRNGTAYNRVSFLPERRDMLQKWADYLDTLRANV